MYSLLKKQYMHYIMTHKNIYDNGCSDATKEQ